MTPAPVSDEESRRLALDPGRSFIVQAPAGSGKTELLIQRYLRLLANVENPAQVIAITFTRKAAAEMRNRVLHALHSAVQAEPVHEPHRLVTRQLALSALERDRSQGWHLQTRVDQLRIQTLDSLNTALARHFPLSTGGVAGTRMVEDASSYYLRAASRTIERFESDGRSGGVLSSLLTEHDNRVDRIELMIAEMLGIRDQWLPMLTPSFSELAPNLERARHAVVRDALDELAAQIPRAVWTKLAPLLAHGAAHARAPRQRERLHAWLDPQAALEALGNDLEPWDGVAALLLTEQGEWRQRVSAREGFGADATHVRAQLIAIIDRLQTKDELPALLFKVRDLPRSAISPAEVEQLSSWRTILLHAVAELRVAFAEDRRIDFVELGSATRFALGTSENPSDLLLAFDRRVQHILVDEFQDTSRAQIQLLELLTAGWQSGDGRSLFLVGDPMQSIYRFRNADMSLFLQTKIRGIGSVECSSIRLTANYRSAPALVDWANTIFSRVFPSIDDTEVGTTRFQASRAHRPRGSDEFVKCHALYGQDIDQETDKLVELVAAERQLAADSSIGILVQSRTHLAGLRDKLRRLPWSVRAVEIDSLKGEQIVQDLLGLTRGLLHFADRVAWLAIFRSPWCGLTWSDLDALAGDPLDQRSIWQISSDPSVLLALSDDGRDRLVRTRRIIEQALQARAEFGLAQWIEHTWCRLGGPTTVTTAEQWLKIDDFFAELARHATEGALEDPVRIESVFGRPLRDTNQRSSALIDIMTIHRAKGLEFDTVIISGLNRSPRRNMARAVDVLERMRRDGRTDLLLAPCMRERSPLSNFINSLESRRDASERTRLLYVAATRARKRLHLVWGEDESRPRPNSRTLLACIWPQVANTPLEPRKGGSSSSAATYSPPLVRLRRPYLHADGASDTPPADRDDKLRAQEPPFEWARQSAAAIGTIVHRYLQVIADGGLDSWSVKRVEGSLDCFETALRLLGVEPPESSAAATRVASALAGVLEDPTGRWLLAHRESARSETLLTVRDGLELAHYRLDRTFVDEAGVRWIVDYKTGTHEGSQLDEFLDSEVSRYRLQLERYASAMAAIEQREIRVGLYFPQLQAFRNWVPELRS